MGLPILPEGDKGMKTDLERIADNIAKMNAAMPTASEAAKAMQKFGEVMRKYSKEQVINLQANLDRT